MPVSHVAQQLTNDGSRAINGSPSHRNRSQAINKCDNIATCNGISCKMMNDFKELISLEFVRVLRLPVCLCTVPTPVVQMAEV